MFGLSVKLFRVFLVSTAVLAAGTASGGPRWVAAETPTPAAAGAPVQLHLRLRNDSRVLWEAEGPRRVWLRVVVVDGNGSPWPMAPVDVGLSRPLPPGGVAAVGPIGFNAPTIPGRYMLLVGVVEERSGRISAVPGEVLRLAVEAPPKETPAP
jgi:hypothetical protein